MLRIPYATLKNEFLRVLLKLGFESSKAEACASIFADNSRDGVYSHGLNRFAPFVKDVKEGLININAEPIADAVGELIERWDGNLAPGMLNARFAMSRAIELAKNNGIGCVALRNTNHWMRGGTYGWQAAAAGCIGICFTNTIANMPPWGGIDPRLGNNPLVIGIPRKEGHIVLDMAMSQYSYGKLKEHQLRGEELTYAGGFSSDGELTKDPSIILSNHRPLPVGLWKGSGLSLVLDLLVTVLSKGRSTADITRGDKEFGISQVFLCIDPKEDHQTANLIEGILAYTKSSLTEDGRQIAYPGENSLKTRIQNMELGIPVDENIWSNVLSL